MSLWSSENDPRPSASPWAFTGMEGNASQAGWFDLSAPVGRGAANRHPDVLRVESLLGETGHYDIGRLQGPTGLWGQVADKAVRDFQKENGLRVDGILNPGGPTIQAMKDKVGEVFNSWTPPSYQEVIDHHNDLADGGSGTLTFGRPPLRMARADGVDEKTSNANRRTLDYLSAYGDNQGLDAAAADEIASGDEAAILRYRDLVWQMAEQDPQRAHGFAWGVLDNLPDAPTRRSFLGFDVPDHRPVGLRQDEWNMRQAAKTDPQDEEAGDSLILGDEQADPPVVATSDTRDAVDEDPPVTEEPVDGDEADDHEKYEKTQDFDEDDFDAADNLKLHGTASPDGNKHPQPTDEPKAGDERKRETKLSSFDKDKFVYELNKNAGAKSKNLCATYLRVALEKGGLDSSGHPESAKDWGPILERNGFQKQAMESYTPQKGDVAVIQPYPGGSKDGHITAYNGSQ